MYRLEIPKRLIEELIVSDHVIYPKFMVAQNKAIKGSEIGFFPTPDVHAWLLETLGEYFYAYRKFDCPYRATNHLWGEPERVKEWEDISVEMWNKINPVIPPERRAWLVEREAFVFRTEAQAATFKLRWF